MKWSTLKLDCLERDRYTCKRCGRQYGDVTPHHIVPRDQEGPNVLENLITLCSKCHDWVEDNLKHYSELKTISGIINSYPVIVHSTRELGGDPWNRHPQVGYPWSIDKKDIWTLWLKQERKGVINLIEEYGWHGRHQVEQVPESFLEIPWIGDDLN